MNSALWSHLEGQSIENTYRLIRLIGVGGFGGVFVADHVVESRIMRQVAVKLIPAEPESMQRQLDELQVATQLRHDHVLRCDHTGSATLGKGKFLYLVMELAEGTLQSRLDQGILTFPEAVAVTEQIASALAFLHKKKLVHRDLKPGNVLLVEGEWKLSDFGLVRQDTGAASRIIGTPRYMPPESFSREVYPGWDIWSLAVLVQESLTGQRPFPQTNEDELVAAILAQAPSIPAGLPEPFGEIVRRGLVKNHRERWTARDILDALRRSSALKVAALLSDARSHRDASRWSEALRSLREAQQLDASSPEISRLIQATEKQRQTDEFERRLQELRSRAEQITASGDMEGALRAWKEVLQSSPDDAIAKPAVAKILEQQRVSRLKIEIKQALDRDDIPTASSLMASLQGSVPPHGPPTVPEPPHAPQGAPTVHESPHAPAIIVRPSLGDKRVNEKDGLTYVWIPPGSFMMGCSPGDQECFEQEKPPHEVTITRGFWIGQTPVTQAAYERVTGRNPSHFKGPALPVESISWDEALAYSKAVGMRLPTEAEWEYAARGGNASARYGDLDALAWYLGNSGNKAHAVAQKQHNQYGLYDMLGNVWEWVADWYDEKYYASSPASDPRGPSSGQYRTLRGGSWINNARVARASYRRGIVPVNRNLYIGVRCAGDSL